MNKKYMIAGGLLMALGAIGLFAIQQSLSQDQVAALSTSLIFQNGTGYVIYNVTGHQVFNVATGLATVNAVGFKPGTNVTVYDSWKSGPYQIIPANSTGVVLAQYNPFDPDRGNKVMSFVSQNPIHVVNYWIKG